MIVLLYFIAGVLGNFWPTSIIYTLFLKDKGLSYFEISIIIFIEMITNSFFGLFFTPKIFRKIKKCSIILFYSYIIYSISSLIFAIFEGFIGFCIASFLLGVADSLYYIPNIILFKKALKVFSEKHRRIYLGLALLSFRISCLVGGISYLISKRCPFFILSLSSLATSLVYILISKIEEQSSPENIEKIRVKEIVKLFLESYYFYSQHG